MGEILRAEGISKTYHTGMVEVHALKKCDIAIRKGEFTAIIGNKAFATNFNPEINIREITQNGRYYEEGKMGDHQAIGIPQGSDLSQYRSS